MDERERLIWIEVYKEAAAAMELHDGWAEFSGDEMTVKLWHRLILELKDRQAALLPVSDDTLIAQIIATGEHRCVACIPYGHGPGIDIVLLFANGVLITVYRGDE